MDLLNTTIDPANPTPPTNQSNEGRRVFVIAVSLLLFSTGADFYSGASSTLVAAASASRSAAC